MMKRLRHVILFLIGLVFVMDVCTAQQCGKNEIPTSCIESVCELRNCGDIGKPYSCMRLDKRFCTDGCLCKEGYLRDENGKCIPIAHCPKLCGKNEIPTSCVESVCELRNCSDIGKPYSCIRLDPRFCTNGCLCKEGYLRDENGICVRISQCPKVCGENEIPTSCFEGICERRNCSDLGKPVICVRPRFCTDGCLCEEGYLRDENGKCIPIAQCPNIQCGVNEIFDVCPPQCPGESCGVDPSVILCLPNPQPGDPSCNPGCRCQDNYFRNDAGCCVTRDQCTVCGINEVYDTCIAPCPPRRCDVDERVIRCAAPPQPGDPNCNAGCRCADNFYRNDRNVCVPRNECPGEQPIICGPDEIYNSCINGGCDRKNCSQPENTCVPVGEEGCRAGCQCIDGLLRADDGTCIPADQCPGVCGENEVPTSCFEGICERRSCSDLGKPVICVRLDPRFCTDGCLCKEGYLRDENGKCIPIAQCPNIQCGANEVFDVCPPQCPGEDCRVDPSVILCLPNPQPGDPSCNPGCRCQDNYFRNDAGCCVTRDQCPVCEINEVYDTCIAPCPPRRCDVDENLVDCAPQPQPGDPDCNAGCRCADNFYRNDRNVCVPRDECPQVCGENEIPTSCFEGICERRNCSDLGKPVICVRPRFCTNGCLCEEGYLRDENGKCIPIAQCPNTQCGTNEIFDVCPPQCPGESCGVDPSVILCLPNPQPGDPSCNPGCRCQDNYFRNDSGCCVTRDQCPKCNGPNEYFSCGSACDNVCATLSIQNQTNCPILSKKCNPKCYCQEGYARDSNNICIPIEDCPPPICGINEVYDTCIAPCPPRRCDVDERFIKCAAPPQPGDPKCKAGCRCADNFYRNYRGVCVPRNECPGKLPYICGRDEIYTSCINGGCTRRNCSQPKNTCVIVGAEGCRAGCQCRYGLLRADNGTCIPAEQCPPLCGINEIYDVCPASCPPRTCASLGIAFKCVVPLQPGDVGCKPSCRCIDGYYKNKQGVCIPKNKCPKPVICGADEVYDSCVNGGCGRRNCSQPASICINLIEGACREGCLCKEGLLRTDDGICIPADQCPTVCGTNEVYDVCPATCPPRTCDALGRAYKCAAPPVPGDPECEPGCTCADGYYRNKQGACVPECECPKPIICGADEVYDSCVNGGCGRWNCSQPGTLCIDLIEGGCREGCRCKEGLLRTDEGICVPADQCPINCFGENEIRGCGLNCPPQTCESIGREYRCPPQTKECRIECRCKEGFFRNKIGECISKEDCLNCTGPNEYFSCGGACDNVCATLANQSQANCPIVNIVCNPKCYCEEGYARDSNNTCVLISECPQPVCGKNEVYDVCPATCPPKTCDALGRAYKCAAPPVPGDAECEPGCRCADDYYRNKQGACVPECECPKPVICGADEVYDSCVNGGCGRRNCSQPESICINLIEGACQEGCLCKEGLLRTDDGICIPADQCPINCFGQNEIRGCGLNCPPQTCESIGREYRCPPQTKECRIECRCKEGFFRNKVGECISKEDCLNCTGPNEYFSCGGACDNVCATLANQSQTNCPIVNVVCNPKCYCEEGYARDSNNTCVLISECPQPVCGENEVYDVCPATCPPRTCDALGRAYKCAAPPVPGDPECEPSCTCADGYYRNKQGACVPECECPKPIICGADEVYDSCVNGGCGRWNCSQPGTLCIDLIEGGCREGCRCKEGLLRTDEGICVPADQCPLNCFGENEIRGCGLNCPPQTCESIGREYRCPPQTKECRIECRCKEGFFRNKIGECISKEDCLNCTGPNEYFSCGGACDNVCATLANQSQANCPIVNIVCNPKCYCEEGYARDSNNTCVLISECPQPICGKNEVFDECPATCPPRTCDALGRAYKCAAPPTPGDPECEPGCRCADGYYRNKQGICVLESECLNCFGQNEMVGCENTCSPQTCESIGKKYNCPLQLAVCRLECRCKKDFLRNKIGQCISKEDCLKCTGPNEYFSCGGACDNVCSTLANQSQANCPIINVVCNPKCYCEEGYARDSNNTCVLISECPQPICGKNEVFDECPATCPPRTCDALGRAYRCRAPPKPGDPECKPSCRCADGYYRNNHGVCVPKNKCPKPVVCGADEVFDSCVNGGCGRWNCSQPGIICIDLIEGGCREGCRCKNGLLRTDDGICIPAKQCPTPTCGTNEVYDYCPPICPPQRCDFDPRVSLCAPNPKPGDPQCKPGCRCIDNYLRNNLNKCIPMDQCVYTASYRNAKSLGGTALPVGW
ncbi:zonadhesin-like isoform X2 [Maniola hyperantus]|uniref:zonadhesin-like isoform X2 n=1 Tax=Aphantopus hyperantus TaxID=2795564 RepID=UPI003749987E